MSFTDPISNFQDKNKTSDPVVNIFPCYASLDQKLNEQSSLWSSVMNVRQVEVQIEEFYKNESLCRQSICWKGGKPLIMMMDLRCTKSINKTGSDSEKNIKGGKVLASQTQVITPDYTWQLTYNIYCYQVIIYINP